MWIELGIKWVGAFGNCGGVEIHGKPSVPGILEVSLCSSLALGSFWPFD